MAVSDAQLEALIKSLEKLVASQEGGSEASSGGTGGLASSADRGTDDDLTYWNRVRKAAKSAREEMKQAAADIEEEQRLVGISIERQRELHEIKIRMADEDRIARAKNAAELKAALKLREDNNKSIAKGNELLAKQAREMEAGAAKAETLANTFLGINGAAGDLARVIPLTAKEFDGWATATIDSIESGAIFMNIAKKIAAESFNLAMATDSSAASFRRMTGAADDGAMGSYGKTISATRDQVALFGAGHKEVAAAMGALYDGYSDFTTLSEDQQTAILAQTVALDALGVSSQTSGQIFDRATKSLGFNESELEGLTETLHATAQSLGKSTKAVFEDFNQVSKQLAFYGKDVVEVFQQLEKQSKATGLSTSELIAISGKAFDTFDGAAKKVGKLNAILGGPYLNSIDMLNASEAERIDMLKQSMDQAGQTFSELNKFEQLAIADALGVDVDTARRMFGELSAAEEMEIRNQEKIAETAREAQAMIAKLKNAFFSLLTGIEPLIWPFAKLAEGLSYLAQLFNESPEWVQKFVRGSISFLATLAVMTYAVLKLSGAMASLGVSPMGMLKGLKDRVLGLKDSLLKLARAAATSSGRQGLKEGLKGRARGLKDRFLGRNQELAPSEIPGPARDAKGRFTSKIAEPPAETATKKWDSFTKAIKKLGKAVKGTWKEMLAFGAAILMIGGGIAAAAYGLSFLVKAFQDLEGLQIAGALAAVLIVMGGFLLLLKAMPPVLMALAGPAAASAGPIIALGFAFLLMGGGIALAALGMAELVKSFKGLNGKELIAAGIGLGIFSLAIYGLISAAAAATVAYPVLLGLAAVLGALGLAALLMGIGINIAARGMTFFMEAAMIIPPDKMMELATAVGMLGGAMTTLAGGLLLASVGFVAIAGALFVALPMIALSIFPLFMWSLALKAVGGALMVIGVGIGLLAANMLLIPPAFVIELGGAFGILGSNLVKLTGGLLAAAIGFGALAFSLLFAAPILGWASLPIMVLGIALTILGAAMLLVGSGMDKMASSMSIMVEALPGLVLLGAALGDMAKGLALFSGALLLLNVKKLQALAEFNNSLITPEAVREGTIIAKPITGEPIKEGTFAGKPAAAGPAATTGAPGGAAAAMAGGGAGGATTPVQPIIKIYLGDTPIENIVKKVIEELPISPYRAV
jgi:hypothetical protein